MFHNFNLNLIFIFSLVDGDPKTRDAVAAVTDIGVTDYIGKLCRSLWCVDTLVLYLTGPARSNGALLMWDLNGDGLTENREMYAIHEIFKQLRNCNAKRVLIIADYSYSGHLVHRLQELQRHRHRDSYKHITVLASSESNEYSWRNEFTTTLIKYGTQNTTRSVHQLFQVRIMWALILLFPFRFFLSFFFIFFLLFRFFSFFPFYHSFFYSFNSFSVLPFCLNFLASFFFSFFHSSI